MVEIVCFYSVHMMCSCFSDVDIGKEKRSKAYHRGISMASHS